MRKSKRRGIQGEVIAIKGENKNKNKEETVKGERKGEQGKEEIWLKAE